MPDVMMSVSDETVMRQAEILVLRQISDNISRLNTRLDTYDGKHEKIITDVGEIKQTLAADAVRRESAEQLREEFRAMTRRVGELEAVHNQQTGATILIGYMKDFGPWVGTILLLVWSLIYRRPA